MTWLRGVFRLPVHESNVVVVLVLCVMFTSFMSVALVWQAQIIANQRETIQGLGGVKVRGLFRPVPELPAPPKILPTDDHPPPARQVPLRLTCRTVLSRI